MASLVAGRAALRCTARLGEPLLTTLGRIDRLRVEPRRPQAGSMHLIMFLIMGLVVGALARLIVPGREPGGWIVSLIIGVVGAYLGGFVGRALGLYHDYQSTGGWIASLVGAIAVAFVYHALATRRSLGGKPRGP